MGVCTCQCVGFFLVAQLVQWNLTGDHYAVAFEKSIAIYEATVGLFIVVLSGC